MSNLAAMQYKIIKLSNAINRRQPITRVMVIIQGVTALLSIIFPVTAPFWIAALIICSYLLVRTSWQLGGISRLQNKLLTELNNELEELIKKHAKKVQQINKRKASTIN